MSFEPGVKERREGVMDMDSGDEEDDELLCVG